MLVASTKDSYRPLTETALLFLDRALIDEDFERGERLLQVARAAAAKTGMTAIFVKMVEQADKQFKAISKEYERVKDAARKLKSAPDDADANLALGRFRCFVRGDWDAGLPLLAKGGDKGLSEAAQKDVDEPAAAAAQAAVGDAWADYADKAVGKEEKAACRRRAYYWYQECSDDLDQKERLGVKARRSARIGKLPDLRNGWSHVDASNATITQRKTIHLLPHHMVATRQLYQEPIDITVTVSPASRHVRITFLNGGVLTVDPKTAASADVRFWPPCSTDPDVLSGEPSSGSVQLSGITQQIRIQMKEKGWQVVFNGKRVKFNDKPAKARWACRSSSPARRCACGPMRA